jgi:predicted RNase H-like HicB family nuclease
MSKRYTISDGKLVLTLEEAEEGGFVVSSPLFPGLWTQAESIAEAFENARDALKSLVAARRKPLPTRRRRKQRAA